MERLPYLDGLRGIAATMVYFNHFAAAFFPVIIFGQLNMVHASWETFFYTTPFGILTNGNYAVHLFIALTAFVMLRKAYTSKTTIRIMTIVGRYARLMLPVAASTLIAYVLLQVSGDAHFVAAKLSYSGWLANTWPAVPSLWVAVREGVSDTLWLGGSQYNGVLWMLHYIWYGSLIAFGIGAFVRWQKIRVLLYIAGFFFSISTPFASFWVGALAYHYFDQFCAFARRLPLRNVLAFTFLILGLLLASIPINIGDMPSVYTSLFRSMPYFPGLNNALHAIAVGCTLVALALSPQMQAVLAARPLTLLGRVGFSTYLLHGLLISSLSSWVLVHLYSVPYELAVGWTFLVTSVALTVFVWVFYTYIEKPSERLSRQIASL